MEGRRQLERHGLDRPTITHFYFLCPVTAAIPSRQVQSIFGEFIELVMRVRSLIDSGGYPREIFWLPANACFV